MTEPGRGELGAGGWAARLRLDKYSAVYLLLVFFIFFGLTEGDTFLTWTSIRLVLTEKAIVGVLALAFLIPLAADTFDLSIGAVMSFSLVIVNSLALNTDIPTGVAAVIAIVACAAVGFVSGFIVVKLHVNSFIATLGMSQVVSGIILAISDNRQITRAIGATYRDFGRTNVVGLPLYFWYMILLAIVLWYVLEHTPIGRYLFATGGNREAARLSGISTDALTWGSLVVSAVIAGFAGIIWSWKVGTFSNSVGPGFLFPAVAAVFFGASQLRGRANVWGTLLAVYALAFGVKGLQLRFSTNTFWIEPLFEGVTLIIAVAIAARKNTIKIKRRDRSKPDPAIDPAPS